MPEFLIRIGDLRFWPIWYDSRSFVQEVVDHKPDLPGGEQLTSVALALTACLTAEFRSNGTLSQDTE